MAKSLILAGAASLLLSLVLGGCADGPSATPRSSASRIAFDPWRDEDYQYRLGPGDELALRFIVSPDLNGSALIGPDGRAVLPLIGPKKLAGLTAEEADRSLTDAYKPVLRSPEVEILVTNYGAAQIFVGGEVREPGAKAIKGALTLAQAVTTAGGFADDARTGKVILLRQRPGSPRPEMRVIDVRDQLHGGSGPTLVRPGDVVFVPRSGIGEVDLFVKQYITNLIPFGFSYGITANGGL